MFKKLIVFGAMVLLVGCASAAAKQAVEEGYSFQTNSSVEDVIEAIVVTLSEENITPTIINEKFGIVSTGEQEIPAKTVDKWLDVPSMRFGASQKINIGFNVAKDGVVKIKFCLKGKDPWSGADSCLAYNVDEAGKYFEKSITAKL